MQHVVLKNQEAKRPLSNLGLRSPLSKVPILGEILFWAQLRWMQMNETVNKFLLASVKFMPEMRLKQPGFTYSACGPLWKNKEFRNLKKLDKACN